MNKHIIYRTTNCLNGRFYVGMHSTDNIDDGYLGSGRRLKNEIKKYGKENFKREVLEELQTRKALELREAELINDQLIANPLCLNLKNGGRGGFDHLNTPAMHHQKVSAGKKGSEAFQKRLREDPEFAKAFGVCEGAKLKAAHAAGKIKYDTFTGRKHSEETLMKMRESKRLRDRQRALAQGTNVVQRSGYDDAKTKQRLIRQANYTSVAPPNSVGD